MKRFSLFLAIILGAVLTASSLTHSTSDVTTVHAAKETWTSVKSKNFILVGNANEKDIRKVAIKLEQFRDVFGRLFKKAKLNSPVPIKVVVFKDKGSYRPFMPTYEGKIKEVGGYFLPGQDVNYITLTADVAQGNDAFRVIFHEYVHSLTNDNTGSNAPWFNEGLAEYYSTFELSDGDKKVTLGVPIAHHIYRLRENKFLPLSRLFAVKHSSPEYNERDKTSILYAQSWALVHYLMMGNELKRRSQFIQFVDQTSKGKPIDESFAQAFQTDYAKMEKELREYIGRSAYPVQNVVFNEKLEFDAALESAPVSEAEWNYYLGDLSYHLNRTDSETYLKKAVALDPSLSVAHASLGMSYMRARRSAEAKQSLQTALATGSQNHMTHYYYAYILSRESMDENNFVQSYPPEAVEKMREHLNTAIRLAPGFPESYQLLAFVNMVQGEQLAEAESLLQRAAQLSPGRHDILLRLAQVRMRQDKFDEARAMLEPLARDAADPQKQANAQSLLDAINRRAEQIAQYKAQVEQSRQHRSETPPAPITGTENRVDGNEPSAPIKDERSGLVLRRKFDGEKVRGTLMEVQCANKGVTLVVKEGEKTWRLATGDPDKIQFVSYTPNIGQAITCGKMTPALPVVVTYRGSGKPLEGEPVAVEFVKPD